MKIHSYDVLIVLCFAERCSLCNLGTYAFGDVDDFCPMLRSCELHLESTLPPSFLLSSFVRSYQNSTTIGYLSYHTCLCLFRGADPVLGVEMSSTGEVACFGVNKEEAFLKVWQPFSSWAAVVSGSWLAFEHGKLRLLVSLSLFF